ncbi:MAG TPA: efflux RND transporter periplasmic adaptor subunit [Vicinamibacterales bacterium]|nr:efflux RND transporter periplasmic adaptor subunit [Vicinamibacterales bacterium]
MKKFIVFLVIVAALGSGAWAYYANKNRPEPTVTGMPVSRGDIVEVVQATGTLEAVTTVDVGTQVSGVVQDLYADFNSIVRKGQVIARLDPSILQTQIESQKANVTRAEADVERLKVTLADAKQKYDRAKAMFDKQLVPRQDYEAAELAVKSADAQIKSSEASLTQSKAALNQAQVNLGYTVITSPIDGIVISRNVDPGQTVASSMNAPTLYVIAADLTKMQVVANIDESDVGRMRPDQTVTFRVDAYPTETFTGTVWQVRLQPTVVQNVVVYSTVIAVPNPQLKLKPGMTANVNIEIARRSNVLRVPSAAARFRPTEQMFQVLNQPVPPEAQRGAGRGSFAGGRNGGGRRGDGTGQPAAGAPAAPGTTAAPATPPAGAAPTAQAQQRPGGATGNAGRPESAEARGGGGDRANAAPNANAAQANRGDGSGRGFGSGRGGFDPNMTPEERRKRMEERLASMTPEERERFQARMREREAQGGGAAGGGRGNAPGAGQPGGGQPGSGQRTGGQPGATAQSGGRGNTQFAGRDMNRGVAGNVAPGSSHASGATTIDALFAPLQFTETRGRVWIYENKQLRSVPVRLGITDGTNQELIDGDLKEGQEVVVNMVTGLEPVTRPGQTGTGNPLMGPQRGGPGGGRGPGGGGRGF